MKSLLSAFLLTMFVLGTTAGLSADARIYVRLAPPPVRREVVVVAPSPAHVWIPGYYQWAGGAYAWVPGRYALPPRPRAVWVAPHWVHASHGWYVVEGRWK